MRSLLAVSSRSASALACSALACLGLLAVTARAGVIVVDPRGGPGATLLTDAIAAAQDGDVLLLRAGDYSSPSSLNIVNNKALTIVADAGGAPVPCNAFWVQQLGAGKQLVLRGLEMTSTETSLSAKVEVEHGPGVVWLEDCTAVGGNGKSISNPFVPETFLHLPGSPAVFAGSDAQVVIQRGSYTGGHGQDGTGTPFVGVTTGGGPALRVQGARVVVHDASITGGHGGDGTGVTNGGLGGDGVAIVSSAFSGSRLLLLGSTLAGGAGGTNLTANPGTGGNGGAGLSSTDSSSMSWLRATAPAGGAAGLGGAGGVDGAPGAATTVPAGTLGVFSAPWRTVALPAPLREGQNATFSVQGEPGDLVLILFALSAAAIPLPGHQGAVVLDPSTMAIPFALLSLPGPTGDVALPFVVPALPLGIDEIVFPVQSAFADTQGQTTLGGASMFIWIDSAF